MTGPGEGKLELAGAQVYLCHAQNKVALQNAIIYIHLKGYSLARVTHLDIEHELINKLIAPRARLFTTILGINNGILIKLYGKYGNFAYEDRNIKVTGLEISHLCLSKVLPENTKTRTMVGGKFGGCFIGFRKPQIIKLEELAMELFGMKPR
jgi:hypothetical protein